MKKYIVKFYKSFIKFIKHNKQFCSYVILSIICGLLLRYFTSGNLTINPLIYDESKKIIIKPPWCSVNSVKHIGDPI